MENWYKKKVVGVVTFLVVFVVLFSGLIAPPRMAVSAMATVDTQASLEKAESKEIPEVIRPRANKEEVLWLARGIYSETHKPHEQELVAWVIRNRVETGYRGKTTYKSAVLDPWQFSAFNRNSPKRSFFISLNENSREQGWHRAIQIADRVANADASKRPFSDDTRHFYSERSMVDGKTPRWAVNRTPVKLKTSVDPRRFRFYADVG